ncbi:MAG: flavodoxin domain-containing protein, partial [Paludibacter sp.]
MNKNTSVSLSQEQIQQLSEFASSLTKEQLAWASGYLAGVSSQSNDFQINEVEKLPAENTKPVLTILYGTRTGNGEGLAKKALKIALEQGIDAKIKSMANYKPRDLQTEKNLLVIVSTHGEGVPPFAAKELYDFIHGSRAPKLTDVNFAVLGLGDSSYFHFCKTGKDFDEQLEKLGAKRLVPILACDFDFATIADEWIKNTLPVFNSGEVAEKTAPQFRMATAGKKQSVEVEVERFSKSNPYSAPIFEKVQLHGKGSDRQTIHIELSTPENGLEYEPGDAAGVMPVNPATLIQEVLQVTGLNADELVDVNGNKKSLNEALYRDFELSKITIDVVTRFLELAPNEDLKALSKESDKFKEYLDGRDIVDLFQDYPAIVSAAQLIKLLRPLQPRYYSISSSPKANPGELHLTVGVVNYKNSGREKQGTCSTFLSEVAVANEHVPVFIEPNPEFRLPKYDQVPIIMVGAGTGIAPYRAFVQHRELSETRGKSWLFFGNRNFESEFLYQTEWQEFIKS